MKKSILALCILSAFNAAFAGGVEMPAEPEVIPGFYIGLGPTWNNIRKYDNVTVDWYQQYVNPTVLVQTGDNFTEYLNFAAPMAQVGYWHPCRENWVWGVQANYKYLGMTSPGNGTLLYNVSSINILNINISAVNRVNHEFMLLFYLGKQWGRAIPYLAAGPAFFYVNSIIRNPTVISNNLTVAQGIITNQNVLIAQTVTANQNLSNSQAIWGGAAQLGLNYYFAPTWFCNLNYTYVVSANRNFVSTVNQAVFNPINTNNSPSTLTFTRRISITMQEFMFSVNKVFAF